MRPESVFASYERRAWPWHFAGTIHVGTIAGGTPTDPKVAEAWLRTKLASGDDLIRQQVAEVMTERGLTPDQASEAVDAVNDLKHLNGFRKDEDGGLFIEGRQLKACLKEATSVAANAGKITTKGWGNPDNGNYLKGIKAWFPEHVFVLEENLSLGVTEPTGVMQRFVHTSRGTGIQYEEYVKDADIHFTIATDNAFTEEQWAMIWLTAEQQGIGASRSQGFGTFTLTRWDRMPPRRAVNGSTAAAVPNRPVRAIAGS
jgi:hypothetical protein